MRAKHARQIRIGIMFQCRPVLPNGTLDLERLSAYQYDYLFNGNELSYRAANRTKEWRSVRNRK